ncbi:MAG TPA: response regulator [Candidatus Methanoperedens sp.]|nr:response regulator [Candidatus Methanoperedens sp.]
MTSQKVLLVDDNAQTRAINAARLRVAGYDVTEAGDGVECIKLLRAQPVDLLVLDLMMPVMDGFKVLQMVKLDPQTKGIPVVVLSGRGQPEEIEKALKLGASDFLVKMRTNPNILAEKVQKTLAATAGPAAITRYLLAIKENILDAHTLARDFSLPPEYHCQKCGNPLVLELIPDFSHHEPWFTGHFVCSLCR